MTSLKTVLNWVGKQASNASWKKNWHLEKLQKWSVSFVLNMKAELKTSKGSVQVGSQEHCQ